MHGKNILTKKAVTAERRVKTPEIKVIIPARESENLPRA